MERKYDTELNFGLVRKNQSELNFGLVKENVYIGGKE